MNPKAALLALLAATAAVPSFALAAPKSHHHNTNLARAAHAHKAHPAELYHGTKVRRASKGPAKRRRCSAAKNAALSSASVSSTSVAAEKATPAPKKDDDDKKEEDAKKDDDDEDTNKEEDTNKDDDDDDNKDDGDDDDNGSSGSGKTYTGDATFYATGLNACGTVDKDSDMIAAVAHENFDSFPGATANPNNNPICDKRVHACWEGKCVDVRITDRCGGCKYGALDFSPTAFKKLADLDLGRLKGMTWQFV